MQIIKDPFVLKYLAYMQRTDILRQAVSYIKSKLLEIDHGIRQSFIKHVVSQQTST